MEPVNDNVPPGPSLMIFWEVTDVNDGVALNEIAGVVPPLEVRFPDAVTAVTQVAHPTVGVAPPELVIGALAAMLATPTVPSFAMPCDAAIVTWAVPVLAAPPSTERLLNPAHATNASPLLVMLVLVTE